MDQTHIELRLGELGETLPTVAPPVAAYVPARIAGDLTFVSGQLPIRDGKLMARGTVPSDLSEEEATRCARQCALNAIAAAVGAVPDGRELVGVVRVGVWVASDPGFKAQPGIANGASELLQAVFGERGRHARAAVGAVALPLGTPVEVEVLFELG
ncbi:MAG: RidA family protein [Planctomycetota bacterium]